MAGQTRQHLKERLLLLVEGYSETDNEYFLLEIQQVTYEIINCDETQEDESEQDYESIKAQETDAETMRQFAYTDYQETLS